MYECAVLQIIFHLNRIAAHDGPPNHFDGTFREQAEEQEGQQNADIYSKVFKVRQFQPPYKIFLRLTRRLSRIAGDSLIDQGLEKVQVLASGALQ